MSINAQTGLNDKEQEVMDHLVHAVMKYAKLPLEHPHELDDFLAGIHRLQDMMAIRVARRNYPGGWFNISRNKL